jgi:hypothetical protein
MRALVVAALGLCAFASFASEAAAQTTRRPTRPTFGVFGGGPPADPNRTRHELTLISNVQGGYDDYVVPDASDAAVPFGGGVSGMSALFNGRMTYWYGNAQRYFSFDVGGQSIAYRDVKNPPIYGGDGNLSVATDVGGKNRFTATQTFRYDPTLILGAFTPLVEAVDPLLLPETGIWSGYLDQASRSFSSAGGFERRWTPHQTTMANLT